MRLHEKHIRIAASVDLEQLRSRIADQMDGEPGNQSMLPIRFAVTKTGDGDMQCEVGVLSGLPHRHPLCSRSLFDFRKRPFHNTTEFTTALVIPTGIDASIGGHAGDGCPVVKLMAAASDRLITHPNAVNAADLNEMPEACLYVEGSVLSRVLMGTAALARVRSNRIKTMIQSHPDPAIEHTVLNMVNAGFGSAGLRCLPPETITSALKMVPSEASSDSRVTGTVEGLADLCEAIERERVGMDALAISSIIEVSKEDQDRYFLKGEIVNPYGGVEAMLTHAISSLFDMPVAHGPMYDTLANAECDEGVYEPRKAAEACSVACIFSVLKGLHKAPRIITDQALFGAEGVVSARDISCLVIPDGCLGLPTLAALHQGIPVIAVKENRNLMQNDLAMLFAGTGLFHQVENYWEAAGLVSALRAGIAPETVRRNADGELTGPVAEGHTILTTNLRAVS